MAADGVVLHFRELTCQLMACGPELGALGVVEPGADVERVTLLGAANERPQVAAEIKRGRKNAKRLRNCKKGNTK